MRGHPGTSAGSPGPVPGRPAGFRGAKAPGSGSSASAIAGALADLERALCGEPGHAVVLAPSAAAREQLFGAVARRLAPSCRVVQPTLGPDGICASILHELGESPGSDAHLRLLSVVQELGRRGSALAILIDDVTAWPDATLRHLGGLAAISRPDVRLVLGVGSEPRPGGDAIQRVVAALGTSPAKIVLGSYLGGPSRRPASGPGAGRPAGGRVA